MSTWSSEISKEEIEKVFACTKSAFEETFDEKQSKTQDWLNLACDFQNEELQTMIDKTLRAISEAEPCVVDHGDTGRKVLTLCEYSSEGRKYENALRITTETQPDQCLGGVCYRHVELDLKLPQECGNLIEDIAKAGGNFTSHPDYLESEDSSSRWGETHLAGGIHFNSVDNTIAYLKQYFQINAAPENEIYTQEWVNWV